MHLFKNIPKLSPTKYGKYRALERIGRGTAADVYRAQRQGRTSFVALKVLQLRLVKQEDLIAHFERQSRLLARLDHPHLVQLRDHGSGPGYLFVVMDLAELSVEQLIQQGPQPEQEIILMATQIAQALDYIHKHNVIHRDVKPSNILRGMHSYVLSDLGYAKVLNSESVITRRYDLIKKSAYLAPESISGQQIGPATDIYALGTVLYEMATGILPRLPATGSAIFTTDFTTPILLPQTYNPHLSEFLQNIIMRALDSNPLTRYQSAADMLVDLSYAKNSMQHHEIYICLGCSQKFPATHLFCPKCGRKSF